MELIRAIREVRCRHVIAVRRRPQGSRVDIPKWVEKAGHRLVGVDDADGYDEIVVEKLH